jgi:hypothetical protein
METVVSVSLLEPVHNQPVVESQPLGRMVPDGRQTGTDDGTGNPSAVPSSRVLIVSDFGQSLEVPFRNSRQLSESQQNGILHRRL